MVLIVEDHQSTRRFLADNLAADGYELLEAETAADAHRQMETRFPDLAIVDLELPDLDGLQLLQAVRGSDRAAGQLDPDLPMLVLTGRSGELDRLRAFDRGADDYLCKPFSYQELARARGCAAASDASAARYGAAAGGAAGARSPVAPGVVARRAARPLE